MALFSLAALSVNVKLLYIFYMSTECAFVHNNLIQHHTTQQQLRTAVTNFVTAPPFGDITSTQCKAGAHTAYITGVLRTLLAYCILLEERSSIIIDCHP
jgi:hypothetical protein